MARDRSVFVNCPFDDTYKPLFDAIVFGITICGFEVRSALEATHAGDLRLRKIVRLIEQSRFSVHDISRIELDKGSGLPRFNMPIELGLALGAKYMREETGPDHILLVMDSEPYRYQQFASDLAGIDIKVHAGKVAGALSAVRDFFGPYTPESLPGSAAMYTALQNFEQALPMIAEAARQHISEVTYVDRLRHLRLFLERFR